MAPCEHLNWFEDNVRWYSDISVDDLTRDVPNCAGWDIEHVLNHLSFGLGVAYPVAITKAPNTDPDRVFEGVEFPMVYPRGKAALDTFVAAMTACSEQFFNVAPETPCWTYAGPGTAAFWFRRAAIETTLHRMDVAEALGDQIGHLPSDRAADAIVESLEFALPLAATMTSEPVGELVVDSPCLEAPLSIGAGTSRAALSGEPHDVLNALWGRRLDRVDVAGDQHVSAEWLGLIKEAFAGR